MEEHRRREPLKFSQGNTRIDLLRKHKCKFWDPWADKDGRVPSAYGNFWRHFLFTRANGDPRAAFSDQIAWVLGELKANPMSRRLVVSAWAPGNAQTSKLPRATVSSSSTCSSTPRETLAQPAPHAAQLRRGARCPLQPRGLRAAPRAFARLSGIPAARFAHTLDRRARLHCEAGRHDGRVRPRARAARAARARAPRPPRLTIGPRIKALTDLGPLLEASTGGGARGVPADRLRPSPRDHLQGRGVTVGTIAAVSPEWVIGLHNQVPWRHPGDFRRFKRVTLGATVIMGRLTWESMHRKPLPGRRNLVVTRHPDPSIESSRLSRAPSSLPAPARGHRQVRRGRPR